MKKFIAALLCLCIPAQAVEIPQQTKEGFTVPSGLGTIVGHHIAESGKMVILLQDLHANSGVQEKIKGLLEHFTRRGFGQPVFVEGVHGLVDSSLLAATPESIKESVLVDLLHTADLTGAEYFSALAGDPYALDGIEDQGAYDRHVLIFQDSYQERHALASEIMRLRVVEVSSIINPKIAARIESYEAYRTGKMDLLRYFQGLLRDAKAQGISLDAKYPALSALRRVALRGDARPSLEPGGVYGELLELSFEVCHGLARTNEAKDKVTAIFCMEVAAKINQGAATEREFQFLLPWVPAATKLIGERIGRDVSDTLRSSLEFYATAYQRDKIMAENLAKEMAERGMEKALVVTGGFHSESMAEILEGYGISSIVVAPHVDRHTKADDERYLSKLRSQTLALAFSASQHILHANKIIHELHRQFKTPASVMQEWKDSVAAKVAEWGAQEGYSQDEFGKRARLAKAEIVEYNPATQNYEILLQYKNGVNEVIFCPAAAPKGASNFGVSRLFKVGLLLAFLMPAFMGVSCDTKQPAVLQPPTPTQQWEAENPKLKLNVHDLRDMAGNFLGRYPARLRQFVREYPDKKALRAAALTSHITGAGLYMIQYKDENGKKVDKYLAEEILKELDMIENPKPEPKKQAWLLPTAPAMPNIPAFPVMPQPNIRERIIEIENELKEESARNAKRPRYTWWDAVRDMRWDALKRKLSEFATTGFLIGQLLFTAVVALRVGYVCVRDRVNGVRMALTEKFPILKDELSLAWILSVGGFLWQTAKHTGSIMSEEQVFLASIGTALTIYLSLRGRAAYRSAWQKHAPEQKLQKYLFRQA